MTRDEAELVGDAFHWLAGFLEFGMAPNWYDFSCDSMCVAEQLIVEHLLDEKEGK